MNTFHNMAMKIKYSVALLAIAFSVGSHCQTTPIELIQGIKLPSATFYDAEGYQIFEQELEHGLDAKGIKKIKRKYSYAKDAPLSEALGLPGVMVLASSDIRQGVTTWSTHYLSVSGEGKTKVIGFNTLCDRDEVVELNYYREIASGNLPPEVFTPQQVSSIQFAGRTIDLGPACRWMGVRNIQCPNMGQMSWSEFSSGQRAQQMADKQRDRNAAMRMGEVLEDEEMDVLFEGVPVKVLKRKLKIKVPQLVMAGSNVLMVYYVSAEVRGRYVACVLSHYTDDIGAAVLPPLLGEVMQLVK